MTESMTDIHNIRPPVMVGLDPETVRLGIWIAAAVLAVLAAALVFRYFWKRRRPVRAIDVTAEIPPYEAAVRSLDRLALDPGNHAKSFYFDLGRTLKAYLGGSYGINSLEMTTPELARSLKSLDMPESLKSEVTAFQDLCDPFRYAPMSGGLAPDRARVSADLATARQLVSAIEADLASKQAAAAHAAGEGA